MDRYSVHFPKGTQLPNRIYRYVSFQEHHIRSLICDNLYFSSPLKFNDPYESSILLEGDERFREILKDDLRKSAMACFSRSRDNFTLWSYYANGLKGICIEYDTAKLISSLINNLDCPPKWLYSFYVDYLDKNSRGYGEIPVIDVNNLISGNLEKKGPELIKIFATKPSCFKSENEFRLVRRPSAQLPDNKCMSGQYKYDREAISCVIFGEKTSEQDIELVKKILGQKLPYKKTKLSSEQFHIEVIDI